MIGSKRVFNFYLNSSIHVALSVFALVQITSITNHIHNDSSISIFAFLGTIVSYNFVKYYTLAKSQKWAMSPDLKLIAFLSFCSLLGATYFFFQLEHITQIVSVIVLFLIILYTLPFFPDKSNARNWAGVKIYVVSLCWMIVTLLLPFLNARISLGLVFIAQGIQRFVLIFVLILIFELIDIATDNPSLETVPQKIGVLSTKIVGTLFLVLFYILAFLSNNSSYKNFFINGVIVTITFLFLFFANENRSKYYTLFWVESIPVLWWIFLILI